MTAVANTIIRMAVPSSNSVGYESTNAYIIGHTGGILVDPAARTKTLDQRCTERSIESLLLTHTHADHVGAAAEYAAEFQLTTYALAGKEDRFQRNVGIVPDRSVDDSTVLTTRDGTSIEVIATPGHATDHLGLVIDRALISGDLVFAEGSVAIRTSDGNMHDYLETLKRIRSRNFSTLYPGHGSTISHPNTAIDRLITHRLAREQRILFAVERGLSELPDIVDAAYQRDISSVRDLAEETVCAHLIKLDSEGSITWDGIRASPT